MDVMIGVVEMKKMFVVNKNGFEIVEFNKDLIDFEIVGYNNELNVSEVIEMDYYDFGNEESEEFENELNNFIGDGGEFGIYSGDEFSCIWKE